LRPEAWSLKLSYTVLAPVYDWFVGPALRSAREASLAALPREGQLRILVNGVGSGLDLPYLPAGHRTIGLDLTPAMLARSLPRSKGLEYIAVQGDSLSLPFAAASFDCAILHLILAVAPDAAQALAETARVVRRGGMLLVLDKFLRRGQSSTVRRWLNPLASRVATRLDVVFEDVFSRVPNLRVVSDEAAAMGGWFRRIRIEKL